MLHFCVVGGVHFKCKIFSFPLFFLRACWLTVPSISSWIAELFPLSFLSSFFYFLSISLSLSPSLSFCLFDCFPPVSFSAPYPSPILFFFSDDDRKKSDHIRKGDSTTMMTTSGIFDKNLFFSPRKAQTLFLSYLRAKFATTKVPTAPSHSAMRSFTTEPVTPNIGNARKLTIKIEKSSWLLEGVSENQPLSWIRWCSSLWRFRSEKIWLEIREFIKKKMFQIQQGSSQVRHRYEIFS